VHIHEADIGRHCPRGCAECPGARCMHPPHVGRNSHVPGTGKTLVLLMSSLHRHSRGQDLKSEMLWNQKKSVLILCRCDLHIATSEWFSAPCAGLAYLPLLPTDTYLLATLSVGVFHRTQRQEIGPCPEHRFIPFSHRLLASSRVGSRSSLSFQFGTFWAVGLAVGSWAFTPRAQVRAECRHTNAVSPFSTPNLLESGIGRLSE
jgi:hypothetical protein